MEAFSEPNQTPMDSMLSSLDIISAWLNGDEDEDIYATPTSLGAAAYDTRFVDDALLGCIDHPYSFPPPDETQQLHFSDYLFFDSAMADSGLCNELLANDSTAEEAGVQSLAAVDAGEIYSGFPSQENDFLHEQPGLSCDIDFGHFLEWPSPPAAASSSEMNSQTSELRNVRRRTILGQEREEEEEEEEGEMEDNYSLPGAVNCKNLHSERNRRKRLSKQLLALRSLVPNITKMDKRSILIDALAYLRGIHEEIARIQEKLGNTSPSSSSLNNNQVHDVLPPTHESNASHPYPSSHNIPPLSRNLSKTKVEILEIDTEKMEDRRFVVKIICKGGAGASGAVLRVLESLSFDVTYIALELVRPLHLLITVFIRVKKQARVTEERLRDNIASTALRSGLKFQHP